MGRPPRAAASKNSQCPAPSSVSSEDIVQDSSRSTSRSTSRATTPVPSNPAELCKKCKEKWAKDECPKKCCFACCKDVKCPPHEKQRQRALRDEEVLKGEGEASKRAAFFRKNAMEKGSYYDEEAFKFKGETATIWCSRDFINLDEVKRDMLRRTKKDRGGSKKKVEGAQRRAAAKKARSVKAGRAMAKLINRTS